MLVLLIGPKGSGKSHIGRLLEARLGVCFFHVEPLWMAYYEECTRDARQPMIAEGITRVHPAIAAALERHQHVCVETTGASPEILDGLLHLGKQAGLLLARVKAPLSLCMERIMSRDQTCQIPMEPDKIRRVYELGESLDLPFAIELENIALTDEQVLEPFSLILRPKGIQRAIH